MVDVDIRVSSHFKEELIWVMGKWLWVISTIMLLETVRLLRIKKELAVLNLKQYIAMWPLVMYSNCFKTVSTVTRTLEPTLFKV